MCGKIIHQNIKEIYEWGWLEKIMEKLGFDSWWRSLVMQRITSVTHSSKIDWVPTGCIVILTTQTPWLRNWWGGKKNCFQKLVRKF